VEREGSLTNSEIVRRLHLSATAGQAAIARLLRHGVLVTVSADVGTAQEKEHDPVISLAPSAASNRLEIIALETKLTVAQQADAMWEDSNRY
jgi:DNA-binding Lrp family transcriptional regulator